MSGHFTLDELRTFVRGHNVEPSVEQQLAALATTEPLPVVVVRIHLGILSPAGTDDSVNRLRSPTSGCDPWRSNVRSC